MNTDNKELKKNLRVKIRKTLKALDSNLRREKSKRFCIELVQLLNSLNIVHQEVVLGLYAPLADEIDCVADLTWQGECAFPGLDDDSAMAFFKTTYSQLIENKSFGVVIKEPSRNCKIITPQVLLIPGVAFNSQGERLGRGKGFYDKYLANFIGIKIGVCFEEQIVEAIPTEPHDQRMDFVVTDGRTFRVGT